MPSCTPGGSTTVHYGFCLPADGETSWGNAYRSTMTAIDQEIFNVGIPRSYLAGMQTTPTQSSTSISIGVGVAMGNDQSTAIRLTSALVKQLHNTWAVGTGNGGLYAATSIQGNQVYHLHAILRTDTSVVDAYFDTVATAVNIPSPYTIYRRLASFTTDGNSNIESYVQDGDYFQMATAVIDFNTAGASGNAITQRLASIPSGVNMHAHMNVMFLNSAGGVADFIYISDLAVQDQAPSTSAAPGVTVAGIGNASIMGQGPKSVRTNVAGQVRVRYSSTGNGTVTIVSTGWTDSRGRND